MKIQLAIKFLLKIHILYVSKHQDMFMRMKLSNNLIKNKNIILIQSQVTTII